MNRTYYDAASLRRDLRKLERRYGISSEEFYVLHCAHESGRVDEIPGFERHVWASFYRDYLRLSGASRRHPLRPLRRAGRTGRSPRSLVAP